MNLRPRRRPVPAIPIVSLIDIMVILLIFFIATTTFKKQKMEVKISLPSSKALGGAAPAAETRATITVTNLGDEGVDLVRSGTDEAGVFGEDRLKRFLAEPDAAVAGEA